MFTNYRLSRETQIRETNDAAETTATNPTTAQTSNFIAILNINGINIGIELNKQDSRGYSAIASLVKADGTKVINQEYTVEETSALSKSLCLVSEVYSSMGLIAQTQTADHQLVNDTPMGLSGYVIGRGNPIHYYIADVPLRGPAAGELFNLQEFSASDAWPSGEDSIVAKAIASRLAIVLADQKEIFPEVEMQNACHIEESNACLDHPQQNIEYLQDVDYGDQHWALTYPQSSSENFIAIIELKGIQIALKINPTDARGYRAIVGLVNENMSATINRPYTIEEKYALNTGLDILATVYRSFSLSVETQIAGNNSQRVTDSGIVVLGNQREPSLLHGHIIGRGDPEKTFIADIPLRGPEPEITFNMRGNGHEAGNDSKVRWGAGELQAIASAVANALPAVLANYPNGNEIVILPTNGKSYNM